MVKPPYPELDDLLDMIGQAGFHLAEVCAICNTFNVKQDIF